MRSLWFIKKSRSKNSRKAVSAVIGGLIMFAMIFTIGFGYFYTEAHVQQQYQQQLSAKESENLFVNVIATGSMLTLSVTNLGVQTNVTSYIVIDNSTQTVQYQNVPGGAFLNPGATAVLSSTISYTQGHSYILKVFTNRGNVFSTTWPLPTISLATQALTSGALGDLYLSFNSYQYYNVTLGSGCPAAGGTYSGYCLTQKTGAGAAFTIPSGVGNIAFAITITDLNAQENEIVLDQFTLLYQVFPHASSGYVSVPWNIVSNKTNGGGSGRNAILAEYTPVVLKYDVPQTLIFAASGCITNTYNAMNDPSACNTFQNVGPQTPKASAGFAATVYIMSHGWEVSNSTDLNTLTLANSNYGQNAPYVSTVYT